MTSLWRREAASKKTVGKIYHQNSLLCNDNEITARITDLCNSFFVKKCTVYVFAFFKVLQQQTIGEVENSITSLWEDNLCL